MNIPAKLATLHCLLKKKKKKIFRKRHRLDDEPLPGIFWGTILFSLSLNLFYVCRIGLKISAGKTNQHKLWGGQSQAAKVRVRYFGSLSCEPGREKCVYW